jgi:hypothetical protein
MKCSSEPANNLVATCFYHLIDKAKMVAHLDFELIPAAPERCRRFVCNTPERRIACLLMSLRSCL